MDISGSIHVWCGKFGVSVVNRIFFALSQVGLLILDVFLNRNKLRKHFNFICESVNDKNNFKGKWK